MSWYVYLPLSLNSANQTRSKSMSLRLFWLSKISRHPTWHAPNVTSPHLIAPKSFGATECPENVDEKPRRHESFDEKSSLFIGICWFTPWCMHSPEQIWYMERVFFCVIWVAYDMIYPFTIHSDGDATDFTGAMLLECLQKWLTCVLDPQWKAVSQRSFLKVWGICPPCFDKISMFSFQSVISAIFSAFSHLYHTVQLLSCRSRLRTSTSFHLKSCHLEHWTTGPLDHHILCWYFTGPWYP